ncbi:unnamed protein product [Phaedon cochleariae]|uniref:Uncharacterized protein n=1 Tax=Phaedon cochleariae TaxID=80249 RepID=A0A9P0DGB8_PHACE|nr:unnamed protein product [Phaedon cochleariae]
MAILTKQFLKIRRNLQTDLKTDEEQIKMLSDVSCKTIQYLESVAQKGQRILSLGQTCKKFETEREKIIKWMPLSNEYLVSPVEGLQVSSSEKTRKDSLKDSVEPMDPLQPRSPELKATRLTKSTLKSKERPKTTIPKSISSPSIPLETPTPELQKITTIQNITLQTRTFDDSSSSSSSATTEQIDYDEEKPKSLLDRCFVSLQGLEGFWFTCNKVQVDYLEVQEEKRVLAKENKQLRGTIRAVLEAAAMSNSIPNSRVSTRLPSRRSAYSAPFRRMVLD